MSQDDQVKTLNSHKADTNKTLQKEHNPTTSDTQQAFDEALIQKLGLQNENFIEMQLALNEARNKYTELYNFSPVGYFTLESEGLIIQTNPIGENMLGVKKQAIINKNFSRYVAPDHQYIFSDFLNRLNKEANIQTCELKLLKRNGPLYFARLEGKTILNPSTNTKQILLVVIDINLRKKIEENVHQYQHQMDSVDPANYIGELAAVIAHELNHPHAVISNYIQGTISLLETGNYKITDLLQAMKQAAQQLDRASEIILRMKNFTCKGTLEYESLCIHSLIQETISLINQETTKFPVIVRYIPIRHPLTIMADKIHVQQVILNLARNALEAMRDNNTIDPKLIIEANHISKDFIEISILDNGPGLPPVAISRLFDPHFTTKPYGIGLGLAVSRSIVQAHGGELIVESAITNGACFKLTLPIEKTNTQPLAYFQ